MLRSTKGNMYDFVTHTWNPIKGKCWHNCSYCYMKRWGEQKPIHLDEREMRVDLGNGNFIFVGSSCDIFAPDVTDKMLSDVMFKIYCADKNKYLLQTKNVTRMAKCNWEGYSDITLCTTAESNRWYSEMGNTQAPDGRLWRLYSINPRGIKKMVTVEPIMDFDLHEFAEMIILCKPIQVNIGADSGHNRLPEPSSEKIEALIAALEPHTIVHKKNNLARLLKGDI